MGYLIASLLIGGVAGLRTFTAPAAVSWAAHLEWLDVSESSLAFMGYAWTPWVLTSLAAAELVGDKLPSTPSRKAPPPFGARLVSGALCGATIGAGSGAPAAGLVAGIVGAAAGTLVGAWARARLAAVFGRDLPAALMEDGVAVVVALLVVASV